VLATTMSHDGVTCDGCGGNSLCPPPYTSWRLSKPYRCSQQFLWGAIQVSRVLRLRSVPECRFDRNASVAYSAMRVAVRNGLSLRSFLGQACKITGVASKQHVMTHPYGSSLRRSSARPPHVVLGSCCSMRNIPAPSDATQYDVCMGMVCSRRPFSPWLP
jgi:hypothetical protein